MAAKRYSIYSASITDGASPVHFTQLRSKSVVSGSRKALVTPGGAVDRGAVILSHADPMVRLETGDLATALAGVSATTGYNATSGATFRAQARAAGGVFAGSGSHVTIASGKGFAALESLSVRQDDEQGASLGIAYYPLSSDGQTAPLTVATGQSLSQSPAFVSRFFLGPVYHNSTKLDGVLSAEVEFGVVYSPVRHDGDVYAREGAIIARNPVFRLALAELDDAANLFNAALSGTLAIYLLKGAPGGARVAAATEQHVLVSCATGAWSTTDKSVAGVEADWAATIEVIPTGVVTVSAAAALPS